MSKLGFSLLCGDVEGRFNILFKKVTSINKKAGPFDLLLCVGNFFGVNNEEFDDYKNGTKRVPISTYILGPNKEEHVPYYSKEDSELCPNVFYLGKRGLYNSCGGLKIAYISGMATDNSSEQYNYASQDAVDLRDVCLKGNPNFKGVDILLTSQWPEGVIYKDAKTSIIQTLQLLADNIGCVQQVTGDAHRCLKRPMNAAIVGTGRRSLVFGGTKGITGYLLNAAIGLGNIQTQFATMYSSWLALHLKPRYHVSGLEGVYYERPPYRNRNSGDLEATTRFIGLARVGNQKNDKWLYALNLTPINHMKIGDLLQKTTDETPCPYDIQDLEMKVTKKRKSDSQQFFYDMSANDERKHGGKGKNKKQKFVLDQSKCWFCLSSPSVEKHLVITVGTTIYLALAKGGLVDEHILICPVEHYQNSLSLNKEILDELNEYKDAIKKFYESQGKCAVFFERNYKTSHMQVQSVPLPNKAVREIKDIFQEEAEGNGFTLQELESHSRLDQVIPPSTPYFAVELPSGEVLYTTIQSSKGFPINFGRDVLATGPLLNMVDRAEWKECILPKEDEMDIVKRIRSDFEPYDIAVE